MIAKNETIDTTQVKACLFLMMALICFLSSWAQNEERIYFDKVSKQDFISSVKASKISSEKVLHFESNIKSYDLKLSSVSYEGLVVAANQVTDEVDAHLFVSLNRLGKMTGYFFDSKEGIGIKISEEENQLIFETKPINQVIDLGHHRAHEEIAQSSSNRAESLISTELDTTAAWNKLQSLPEATDVVYLDFDGGKVYGTSWNNRFDEDTLYVEGRIFPDGTSNGFSQDFIKRVWLEVAEDFLPFNVNITTDSTIYHSKDDFERLICYFAREVEGWGNDNWDGEYPAGVAAAVDAYAGTNSNVLSCWVFSRRGSGAIASHELGHLYGLFHHGTDDGNAYYQGHGDWGPIMGNTGNDLITWSKGEYLNANRPDQDDIAVIGREENRFGIRADDHGETFNESTSLVIEESREVLAENNQGIITEAAEADFFSFVADGAVSLSVNTTGEYSNLNIALNLYDQTGSQILVIDETSTLDGSISTTLELGQYYLKVDGVGELDPLETGYSDYASLGSYSISGFIENNCIANGDENCDVETTVVLSEENTEPEILFYPNPSLGVIHLSAPSKYVILDLNGVELLSGKGSTIDMGLMESGVYLLRAGNQQHRLIKK